MDNLQKTSDTIADTPEEIFKFFAKIALFFLAGIFIIYIILGFTVDFVVDRIPKDFEYQLAKKVIKKFNLGKTHTKKEKKIQLILDKLLSNSNLKEKYKIHIKNTNDVNALAFPGGHIVIYQGLLDKIKSENELAMILGHELGHYKNRDHFRKLGRSLALTVVFAMILGTNSPLTAILDSNLFSLRTHYSKQQEYAADKFGLELLNKSYGHSGGATDFFHNFTDKESAITNALFNKSHPAAEKRIQRLEKLIKKNSYKIEEKIDIKF